ncbi:hypothetical protein HZU75_09580 [Chitinibacter fontanus]|uniref:DUF342 domain-containing protein n=1 Tax=Chitinibacter fontanus TaxID=1737446 RepID=A0A7D5Z6I7_9NEIS|nr:hypothetical protein [Chitinibacter fontanus]QLI81763.1 hypothetical protein HZU75_09580 [Chitinibacter fontanus]
MYLFQKQRGVATILILLLSGLSLTAAVVGTAYYVRSTQEVQLSEHALTQAQIKTWTGAQVVQQYLITMTPQQLRNLGAAVQTAETATPAGLAMTFGGVDGISARAMQVDFDPVKTTDPIRLRVQITGTTAAGSKAESRSTLDIVYNVQTGTDAVPPVEPVTPPKRGVVMFKKGLNISGDIKLFEGDTKDLEVIVDGDVSTSGSMSGVDIIKSSGNITIGSTGSYEFLHANGWINVSNSAVIKEMWSAKYAEYPSSAEINMSNGNAQANIIKTNGNVSIKSSAHMGAVYADGKLSWSGDPHVDSGQVGSVEKAVTPNVKVTIDPSYKAKVPLVSMNPDQSFDAYAYKSIANYVFEVDANGYRKVTIRNVAGIDNGTYFLGNYSQNWNNDQADYLCLELDSSSNINKPMCKNPTVFSGAKTICKSGATRNESACFSYAANTKTWNISDNGNAQIAPGVAWFEGNLNVKGDKGFYNSFIVTGNVSTSGNVITYAPNFAGYQGGTYDIDPDPARINNYTFTGTCVNSIFPSLYPKQFCEVNGVKVSADNYQSEVDGGIGNFAYLAGSFKNGSYQGGDINLGASNYNFGSVWAGNLYGNGGNTNVFGYITALALGDTGTTNKIAGGTTINLQKLPTTYTPGKTLGGEKGTPGTPAKPGTPNTAKVKWSRYM